MINITVLAFDYVLPAALMGIHDLLYYAGRAEQHGGQRRFTIRIASWDGLPVRTMNQLTLTPHCAVQDIEHSDVYLVPTIAGNIEQTLEHNPQLIQLLQRASKSDCLIGSNSSGVFFLAEAGLLDQRPATTHWSTVELFRKRYPLVDLRADQQLIHDGNTLCDAGGMSWFDLGLYLVELFCDHQTAVDTARFFMVDSERTAQLTFSPMVSKKYHSDQTILEIQNWMEDHYRAHTPMEELGNRFGLSNRSLIRRFKQATGITPSHYLQETRIDNATRLLVRSNKTVEEITHAVGYEDISSFTRLFKRKTGLTPSNYRARFKALRPH